MRAPLARFLGRARLERHRRSSTLRDIASVFPISHLNNIFFKAFNPATRGAGIAGHDLLILALWGVGGLVVALWRFSWYPLAAD
jgi:hypothetical protein